MRIAVVGNSVPGLPVAEYVHHATQSLAALQGTEVVLIGNAVGNYGLTLYKEVRAWEYGSVFTPIHVVSAVQTLKPDIVWFNITLGAFGGGAANFLGLTSPLLVKLAGVPVVITLHNVADGLALDPVTRVGATIATRALSAAGTIAVMVPKFEQVLSQRYGARVVLMPHGVLGKPQMPEESTPPNVLSFGMYGGHKRLEPLLEAMQILLTTNPDIKLLVAGGNNAHYPGYVESLRERYLLQNVEWIGYVPEEEVPRLFSRSRVVILTNEVVMGESGAFAQASMYGKPVITGDLPIFREKQSQGYAVEVCKHITDPACIARSIVQVFAQQPEVLQDWGRHNYQLATKEASMEEVARQYLNLFIQLKEAAHARPQIVGSRRAADFDG